MVASIQKHSGARGTSVVPVAGVGLVRPLLGVQLDDGPHIVPVWSFCVASLETVRLSAEVECDVAGKEGHDVAV